MSRLARQFAQGCVTSLFCATAAAAQQGGMIHPPGMQHTPGMEQRAAVPQPTQGGQGAFAAVSEIVRLLEADSTTDWSKVNLEALRQHLIDMDAVTLRARVQQVPVPSGLQMDVTGDAAVAASIRRMVTSHVGMMGMDAPTWRGTVTPLAGGVRFTVKAKDATDTAGVARIRGLGFIGLLTQGDHHARHHLMIARGSGEHAHDME